MRSGLHRVEVWVSDFERVRDSWAWLLESIGFESDRTWHGGESWRFGDEYVVVEASPDVVGQHDRCRAGVNHLAFWGGGPADVDRIALGAPRHGWTLLFPDRHPFAGGPDHYAAFLENVDGFEVELVADQA